MSYDLTSSCKIAFAGLTHDIGKVLRRTKKDDKTPAWNYTQQVLNGLKLNVPNSDFSLNGENLSKVAGFNYPETKGNSDLQQLIYHADRLAFAFELKNDEHVSYSNSYLRLMPLFCKMNIAGHNELKSDFRYKIAPLTPTTIFPQNDLSEKLDDITSDYKKLFDQFRDYAGKIKSESSWDLWLDHFDTFYSTFTSNIPATNVDDTAKIVSLYDHSKTTAAFATALWQYHQENPNVKLDDDNADKFLLIQSSMSGIQDFIFGSINQNKYGYKLVRGRSFFVSLISECVALKLLQELNLPSTSQIMNAAGKFIIVAPNLPEVKEKIKTIKTEIDKWVIDNFYGELSVGIYAMPVKPCEFNAENDHFRELQTKIFDALEKSKLQNFDMCQKNNAVMDHFWDDFENVCYFDGKYPGKNFDKTKDGKDIYACPVCSKILDIGESLPRSKYIEISKTSDDKKFNVLGYDFRLTENLSGTNNIVRLWNISIPTKDSILFNDCARRNINTYVAKFEQEDVKNMERYHPDDRDNVRLGAIKTFSHLAYESENEEKKAVMSLKGDIDSLGILLQSIQKPTFSTMVGLSRQINNFFAVYLAYMCANNIADSKNTYTIFAGGDDFFFIGPWARQIKLANHLRKDFTDYVCGRPDITFSIGLTMFNSGENVKILSDLSEDNLEKSKKFKDKVKNICLKNNVTCFDQTVSFADFEKLTNEVEVLENFKLSEKFVYDLFDLCDKQENIKNASKGGYLNAIWKSHLMYRVNRLEDKSSDEKNKIAETLTTAIEKYGNDYRIALSLYFYKRRGN